MSNPKSITFGPKPFPWWVNVCLVVAVFGLFCLVLWALGQSEEEQRRLIVEKREAQQIQYIVTIGNWVGSENYECYRYERDGNTYILYNKLDEVVTELTASDGFSVRARRIEE